METPSLDIVTKDKNQLEIKKQRLLGIDLIRGIAAFGVVLLHSGDATWGDISSGALQLRTIFSFSVPFFLAISFYFLGFNFFTHNPDRIKQNLKTRIKRIAIPYFVWSAIYILFKSFFFIFSEDKQQANNMAGDLFGVLLFGKIAYHLYFLPLLLTGTIAFFCIVTIVKHWTMRKAIFLAIISFGLRLLILGTNNQFLLGENIAFDNFLTAIAINPSENLPVRFLAVVIAWTSRCLPYISVAILLSLHRLNHNWQHQENIRSTSNLSLKFYLPWYISLIIFFSTVNFDAPLFLRPFKQILVAYSLIEIGIYLSSKCKKLPNLSDDLTASLGKCSLGIYLLHPIVNKIIKMFTRAIDSNFTQQVSIASMIIIASLSFSICWLLVAKVTQYKQVKRVLGI